MLLSWFRWKASIKSMSFQLKQVTFIKKEKGEKKKEPLLLLVCLIKVKFRSVQRQCNWGNVNIPSYPLAFKTATGDCQEQQWWPKEKNIYIKKTAGSPEERKCGMVLGINPMSLISSRERKQPPRCWAGPSLSPQSHPAGSQMCLGSLPVPQPWGWPQVLALHPCESPSLRARSSLQSCSPFSCSVPPPRGLQPWLLTPGAAAIQIIQVIIFNYRGKNGKKKKYIYIYVIWASN